MDCIRRAGSYPNLAPTPCKQALSARVARQLACVLVLWSILELLGDPSEKNASSPLAGALDGGLFWLSFWIRFGYRSPPFLSLGRTGTTRVDKSGPQFSICRGPTYRRPGAMRGCTAARSSDHPESSGHARS